MRLLRGGVAWFCGVGIFLAMLLLVLLMPLGGPRRWDRAARGLGRALLACFGQRVEIEGELPEPGPRGLVLVSNHVNFLDGFLLYGFLPLLFRVLEQREHFSWPLWGWFSRRFGNIPLDQSGGGRTAGALRAAGRALDAGTSILVFPEAHRSRDGRMADFHRGAFRLARHCGAAILPVVMCGAFAAYHKGGGGPRPGAVRLLLLPVWSPERVAGLGEKELRDAILGEMREALARGEAALEAGAAAEKATR